MPRRSQRITASGARTQRSATLQPATEDDTGVDSGKRRRRAKTLGHAPVADPEKTEQSTGLLKRAKSTVKCLGQSLDANKTLSTVLGKRGASPWDPTERKRLDCKDLDLGRSYKPLVKNGKYRGPRLGPWPRKGSQIVTDVSDLPADWRTTEPDLDPEDFEAQIERCDERIQSGYFTHIFEARRKGFVEAKARRDEMTRNGTSSLSLEVLQRIETLTRMHEHIVKTGDKYSQIENINAILKAYRAKQLKWNPGLVTYWSNGIQCCQPRPFDWDEFEAINDKHKGEKGFWVEGTQGQGLSTSLASMKFPLSDIYEDLHFVSLAVRLPGYSFCVELDFVYDTGSSLMHMYESDLDALVDPRAPIAQRVMGYEEALVSGGSEKLPVIEVEVTMFDERSMRMTPWTRVQCAMYPGQCIPPRSLRLDGPFLRRMLFTGLAPDKNHQLHIASERKYLKLPAARDMSERMVPWQQGLGAPQPGERAEIYPPSQGQTNIDRYALPRPAPGV